MKDGEKRTQDALRMALGLPETVKTAKGMDSTKSELKKALGINRKNPPDAKENPLKTLSK